MAKTHKKHAMYPVKWWRVHFLTKIRNKESGIVEITTNKATKEPRNEKSESFGMSSITNPKGLLEIMEVAWFSQTFALAPLLCDSTCCHNRISENLPLILRLHGLSLKLNVWGHYSPQTNHTQTVELRLTPVLSVDCGSTYKIRP